MPALHFISSFEDTSYKKLHDTSCSFVSYCFTLAFIYIRKYDLLQDFRTSFAITGKSIFDTNSHFLMDSPKALQPLNSQSPLSVTKFFC